MNKNQRLSLRALFLMGGALFAMHFGGASMIWPMTWGKESASLMPSAFLGVFLTALFLPFLAYVALARGRGTFLSLTLRAVPYFGHFFCAGTILVLGPLFVIPRMSAASWDVVIQLTQWDVESKLPLFLFSCAYYAVTWWFVFSRTTLLAKIGYVLFPALLLIVAAIVGRGLLDPIAPLALDFQLHKKAIAKGFLEGYATGDLLCSLVFGVVILRTLGDKGLSITQRSFAMVRIALIGIGILSCIHLGHMLVGSTVASRFLHLQYADLYVNVVMDVWGHVGGMFFCVALLFAALTTAIGLTAATAEYFAEASNDRLSYRSLVIVVLAISTLVGTLGLEQIVAICAPLLDAFYPGAILLTLYYALMPEPLQERRLQALRFGIVVSFMVGLADVALIYAELLGGEHWIGTLALHDFVQLLPLSEFKLSWIPISLVAMFIGYCWPLQVRERCSA